VLGSLTGIWNWAQTNAQAIELSASLLALGGLLLRFGRPSLLWLNRWVWLPIQEARTRIPKLTLIVQPGGRAQTFWNDAKWRDQPMTQATVALRLTNVAHSLCR
jgi:hypothetical protein